MEYEDRIVIPTPEGVQIAYVLAGVGSRFTALLLDLLVRAAVLLALLVVLLIVAGSGSTTLIVILVAGFLAVFAYDIVFEVWAGGRTPGKRWTGLRVVMMGGQPIGLGPSAARNLLRLIDLWLTVGLIGGVAIILSDRNQRVGDLAAGTIVIREPAASSWESTVQGSVSPAIQRQAAELQLDLTALTPAELGAVRDFLARRSGLTSEARHRVAGRLADSLRPKVGGLPPDYRAPEYILEMIAVAAHDR